MMEAIEEHKSPDGLLTLVVTELDGGDIGIGFAGFSWHTHADILASLQQEPETVAVRRFIDEVIRDQRVIAVLHNKSEIIDAWVTEDPKKEIASHARYAPSDETLELRYWSGKQCSV